MKKIIALSLLFVFSVTVVVAQGMPKPKSTVRIRLSDGYPLTVNINDRDYKKVGQSITIGDLPKKRHDLRVYRIRTYSDGSGGKADLIYSGRIKLEPGNTYDCVVDVNTRKFRMKKVKELPLINSPANQRPVQQEDRMVREEAVSTEFTLPETKKEIPKLNNLKNQIDNAATESDKLKLAKKYVDNNSVNTEETAHISSWLLFDDSKLAFFKHAKNKISDKQNFRDLVSELSLEESQKEFMKIAGN